LKIISSPTCSNGIFLISNISRSQSDLSASLIQRHSWGMNF
jgi:hypothetical protein